MRRTVGILAIIALIAVGAWAYTRPGAPVAAPSLSPMATATQTAAVASPTPAATPTGSVSPTPSPTATPTAFGPALTTGGVTLRTASAPLSADFRYVITREPTATKQWVVLLDLAGRRAHYVAEVEIALPAGRQTAPPVAVHPTSRGDRLLVDATEPGGRTRFFIVDVTTGQARALLTTESSTGAALSPDGTLFAFTEHTSDPARNGLWVRTVAEGSPRRLISEEPQGIGRVALPRSFSPDGSQLAAIVTFNPGDTRLAIVDVDGPEARIQGENIEGVTTTLAGVTTIDWRGEPSDVWAWNTGRGAFGESTVVYSFDLRASMPPPARPGTAQHTVIYDNFDRPPDHLVLQTVDRHPDRERFVTWEDNGFGGAGQIWVRTRQGGATKVADVGEGGPRDPWWSRDGSRLYAFRGEDDSVGTVVDVLTGEVIVDYCIRNAGPGCV